MDSVEETQVHSFKIWSRALGESKSALRIEFAWSAFWEAALIDGRMGDASLTNIKIYFRFEFSLLACGIDALQHP